MNTFNNTDKSEKKKIIMLGVKTKECNGKGRERYYRERLQKV